MSYETTLLIKIDRGTKLRMKKAKLNWSAQIRGFINKELNRRRNIAYAEKIRAKLFRKSRGIDSTLYIRKMRDARYGKTST